MKNVKIYVRVNQLKNLDGEVENLIGCLLLEYMGNKKYFFYDNLAESTIQQGLLSITKEGIQMLKEPCSLTIHTVTSIAFNRKRNGDLKSELLTLIDKEGHTATFLTCHESDEGEQGEIFKKFKGILDKHKRQKKNVYSSHRGTQDSVHGFL